MCLSSSLEPRAPEGEVRDEAARGSREMLGKHEMLNASVHEVMVFLKMPPLPPAGVDRLSSSHL